MNLVRTEVIFLIEQKIEKSPECSITLETQVLVVDTIWNVYFPFLKACEKLLRGLKSRRVAQITKNASAFPRLRWRSFLLGRHSIKPPRV